MIQVLERGPEGDKLEAISNMTKAGEGSVYSNSKSKGFNSGSPA